MTWSVGFLHGADADVGDFGGAREAERVGDHFRDVLRVHEQVRLIGAAFLFEEFCDARRGGAARVNAQGPDAEGVYPSPASRSLGTKLGLLNQTFQERR